MKTIIIFACVFVAAQALTDDQKEKLKKHHVECLSEVDVDLGVVQRLRAGDYKQENDGLKKFVLCMLIKSELMTKEGKFKKDIALAKIPVEGDRAIVEKVIDGCLTNKGNSPEQSAWNYVKCYHEKNPKHPIL